MKAGATIANSQFVSNKASVGGGAIAMERKHSPASSVTACTFAKNSARRGGGLWITNEVCVSFGNLRFDANRATKAGGAIFYSELEDVSPCALAKPHSGCIGCVYSNNEALYGAAIGSSPTRLFTTTSPDLDDPSTRILPTTEIIIDFMALDYLNQTGLSASHVATGILLSMIPVNLMS